MQEALLHQPYRTASIFLSLSESVHGYGNEVEFEFLDLIPYRQNEYVVLLPIGDSDGQVVILQLKEIDDETEEYVGVENEFVLETVFALFKERNKDFFTFE